MPADARREAAKLAACRGGTASYHAEMPHVIRLDRAWEFAWAPGGVPLSPALATELRATGRIDLPCDCPAPGSPGQQLLLTRRFNRPSNLLAAQQVFVILAPRGWVSAASLNGNALPDELSAEDRLVLTVGPLLQRHNRLDILVASPDVLGQAQARLVIADDGPGDT